MYIILLGGNNDQIGNLSNSTSERLNTFVDVYEQYKLLNPKIIISGGFRFYRVSHCQIIREEIFKKNPTILIEKEFIENNDTID